MKHITNKRINEILVDIFLKKNIYNKNSSMIGDQLGNIIFCFGDQEYTNKIMKYYTSNKIRYYFRSIIPNAEIINDSVKSTDVMHYYISLDDENRYILITKKEIGYKLGDVVLYEYNICSA